MQSEQPATAQDHAAMPDIIGGSVRYLGRTITFCGNPDWNTDGSIITRDIGYKSWGHVLSRPTNGSNASSGSATGRVDRNNGISREEVLQRGGNSAISHLSTLGGYWITN